MKIKFLGAAGTVTGSSYVLTSGSGQSILIDLGMFQGVPAIEKLNYERFDYDMRALSGVVLTHAHLDHCGRLPILFSHGYEGDIWMTPPTYDLTELSLFDSAKIARQDAKPVLYDKELVEKTVGHFKTVEYRTPFVVGDFSILFRDAGHILGSASLEIIDNSPDSELRKIIFSGDLGNSPEDLLLETELLDESDAVVMESTYGDRLHPEQDPVDILTKEIQTIEDSEGTLLIPAFSLDRTQELLHIIMHLKQNRKIAPDTKVFLDSPMAEKATVVYTSYAKLFNAHVQADLKKGYLFGFPGLEITAGKFQQGTITRHLGAKVIIAGSGMMTGGRIMGHALKYLPESSTRLLIVGYQGEETLGRELLEGSREVQIGDTHVSVKANVRSTGAMSAHADQKKLLYWLENIKNVKKVFLTHGDDVPRRVLAQKISNQLHIQDVILPMQKQEVQF